MGGRINGDPTSNQSERENQMIRKLESLGLALVAVLAMSVVVASAASAAPEFTGTGTATGSQSAGGETFTTSGGTVQCDSHFAVEKVGGGALGGAAQEVTVVPSYSNCVAFGFIGADIHENGCHYVLLATERRGFGLYSHHVRLECPGTGGGIVITAATCEVKIPEEGNANLTRLTTINLANGTITTQWELTGWLANVLKDAFGCPFSGTGSTTAAYHGHLVIARVGGGSISVSGE
jgi:hypothetical protein